MQFDWTTFILEILNFLVLLWIMQRLVYRPVLAMLDERQQRIQGEIDRAKQLHDEAETLRRQYETRLADWQREQETARRQLEEELALSRSSALDELKQNLSDEEAKIHARNQALTASRETVLVREAAGTAYAHASAMLQRLASPQLTDAIVAIFLEDLRTLADSEKTALQKAATMLIGASAVEVISAHTLDGGLQDELSRQLSATANQNLTFAFKQDPNLLAGLRVIVGECQLHANLADELAFFRRQINHG